MCFNNLIVLCVCALDPTAVAILLIAFQIRLHAKCQNYVSTCVQRDQRQWKTITQCMRNMRKYLVNSKRLKFRWFCVCTFSGPRFFISDLDNRKWCTPFIRESNFLFRLASTRDEKKNAREQCVLADGAVCECVPVSCNLQSRRQQLIISKFVHNCIVDDCPNERQCNCTTA